MATTSDRLTTHVPSFPALRRVALACAAALLVAAGSMRAASAAVPGDLDANGVATVRDAVLLVNAGAGVLPLPPGTRALADLDQDGVLASADVAIVVDLALGLPLPPEALTKVRSSPASGEGEVAVTRETILRFGRPLRDDVVPTATDVFAQAGEDALTAQVHLSPDRSTLTLFYLLRLPDSKRVRITVDGTNLVDAFDMAIDADGDGVPGGIGHVDFDTLTLSTIDGTSVFGRVFASEPSDEGGVTMDVPLAGVTVTVDGKESTLHAVTDGDGNFTLSPAPAGPFFVHVHGQTATDVGSDDYYPEVGKLWMGEPGTAASVGDIYLPLIVSGTLQDISPTEPTTIEFPDSVTSKFPALSGTELTVPADALYGDDGQHGGQVGIAPVAPDRLPGKLPEGLSFPLVITVQTSAGMSNFDAPVPACFPNLPDALTGKPLDPGAESALWSFNHDTGRFEIVGPMRVTEDGSLICTDPGVGILAPGWHGSQPGSEVDTPPPGPPPCEGFGTGDAWDVGKSVWDCVQKLTGALRLLGKLFDAIGNIKSLVSDIATLREQYANGTLDREGLKAGVDGIKSVKELGVAAYEGFAMENPVSKALAIAQCATGLVDTIANLLCKPECLESSTVKAICNAAVKLTGLANAITQRADDLQMSITQAPLAAVCAGLDALTASLSGTEPIGEGVGTGEANGDPDPELLAELDDVIATGNAFTQSHEDAGNGLMGALEETSVPLGDTQVAASQLVFDTGGHGHAYYRFTAGAAVQRGQASASGQFQLLVPPAAPYTLELLDAATGALSVAMGVTPANGARGTPPPFVTTFLDGEPDGDGDGLADVAEPVVGTDEQDPDSDDDGVLDGAEIQQGTDPLTNQPGRTGLIATADTPGTAVDITACDDVVVVADSDRGIAVFNVYNGMDPTIIGQVDTPGTALAVACDGTHVAVADGTAGLAVVDITSPPAAHVVHQVALRSTAQAVTVTGGVAYVGLQDGRVESVDLASGTVLERVLLGSAVQDLAIGGDVLYALTAGTLHAMPLLAGPLEVSGTASAPGQTGAGGARWRLFVGGGIAYATHTRGYDTFDLADPLHPALIAAGSTAQFGWRHLVANGSGRGVACVGPNSTNDGPHDVSLYDISNPAQTDVFLATFVTPGLASASTISNGLAYVADGTSGLSVVSYLARDTEGMAPTVAITTNLGGEGAVEGQPVRVSAEVTDDVQVRNVEFYVDGVKALTDGSFPFEYRFTAPIIGEAEQFTLRALATDTGGNATWSDELVVPLMPDTEPPSVVRVVPRDELTVLFGRTVAAYFSEPVATETVDATSFRLLSAGEDAMFDTADDEMVTDGSLTYRDELQAAFLTFAEGLPDGLYRATLTTAVTDRAGNALASDVTWSFEVSGGAGIFGRADDVLAQLELEGDVADSSGNDRDATLLGGQFVATPLGQGLHVGPGVPAGFDWSAYAALLVHPYTVEMVLTPQDTSGYRKLFSFADNSDSGWYYRSNGINMYPTGQFATGSVLPGDVHYLAFVSTSSNLVDIYFQGVFLAHANMTFTAPPGQAIFFLDDTATGRGEQLDAVVEAVRISGVARSADEIAAVQERLTH